MLAAHHDERHAWNTQLVLADGKNKGLHFSQNNEVGRKETNCKKMEVVLGAEMPSALLPNCLCFCLPLMPTPEEMVQRWLKVGRGLFFFFFLKNKHKYNCVLVCMYRHNITAKLFPLRKICKVPKREKECLLNPIVIPSDQESFIHHLQGFRSRAVCPGEHTGTTQCRNRAIYNIADWKHKVDVCKLLCTSLIH